MRTKIDWDYTRLDQAETVENWLKEFTERYTDADLYVEFRQGFDVEIPSCGFIREIIVCDVEGFATDDKGQEVSFYIHLIIHDYYERFIDIRYFMETIDNDIIIKVPTGLASCEIYNITERLM